MAEHIVDKSLRLKKKVHQMLTTYERYHRTIFDDAVGKHLTEKGKVNLDLLERSDKQKAVARHMSDYYVSLSKQDYNINEPVDKEGKIRPFDEAENKMIARLIGGTTYDTLYRAIAERGKDFTFDYFYDTIRPALMRNLNENLGTVPVEHFGQEDIGTIVGYIEKKQGKPLDFINRNALRLEDALKMLEEYDQLGLVPERAHQKKHYYVPKHKRQKD